MLERARLSAQIDTLANFIMREVPGEPSKSEGAVDCAMRIIRTQHATIADLQGQAKDYQACRDVLDSTVLELTQVQQRVAQLEGELERMKAIKHDDNTQMERAESDKWDAKDHASTLMQRAIYAEGRVCALLKDGDDKDARIKALIIDNDNYRRKYHALQADHARVLGLVRALPVAERKVKVRADGIFRSHLTVKMVGIGDEMTLSGTPELIKQIAALLQYRASLPAQPAQGGA